MGPVEKNAENMLDLTQVNNSEMNQNSEIVFLTGQEEVAQSQLNDVLAVNIASSLNEITYDSLTRDGITDENLDMVLDKVISAISCVSSLQFKGSSYVEPKEIDQVKKVLEKENCNLSAKRQIEMELTKFQEKIELEYKAKIREFSAQKIEFEQKIEILEQRKNKLISERLSQFSWPFDEQTRAYDKKIDEYRFKIKTCEMKIEAVEAMRPAAGEKDILIFQHQLKEKFST